VSRVEEAVERGGRATGGAAESPTQDPPSPIDSDSEDIARPGTGLVRRKRRSRLRQWRGPGLSRRVEKVLAFPPLSEMGEPRRREFDEALVDANCFEDLPGNGRRRP
jgi:hypothetical protein